MNLSDTTYQAPPGFKEQTLLNAGLADGFVSLPSRVGYLNISFNSVGVSAVAPVTDDFVEVFRDRFRRQVVEVDRLPEYLSSGVHRTLETGQLAGLSIDWRGQTSFQKAVLTAAAGIPSGEVRPYGWIARKIGRPSAVRAVGSALGQNPVPILVACHRVVRADGSLGQYRFGTPMKAALLESEGLHIEAARGVLTGNTDTNVVCYPSCGVVRNVEPGRQRWFRSNREAAVAGYRPCHRCQPILSDR